MTYDSSAEFTELRLSCACRKLRVSIEVPTSKLPLKLQLCHCDTCRHVSGVMCVTVVNVPPGSKDLKVQGSPTKYNTSAGLARCFCGTCGTSVYEDSPDPSKIGLCTGALEKSDGVVELDCHIYVADTQDGGLRNWLPDLKSWEEGAGESAVIPYGDMTWEKRSQQIDDRVSSKYLKARCHCKGVEFEITRPSHNTRWEAKLDACNSCRLGCGYDVQQWAYVPKEYVLHNGAPLNFENLGTLKKYNSSEGVYRYFCGSCGAVVFWYDDDREASPEKLVDISVGLLEANSGARAEDWLDWCTDRISLIEYAQNKTFMERLAAGLREWGSMIAGRKKTP